jgi:uncharacterized protein YfiM (DUF2279 family)
MRFSVLIWLAILVSISLAPQNVKHHFIKAHGRPHIMGHAGIFLVTALVLSAGASTRCSRLLRCGGAIVVAFAAEAMETAYFHSPFEWQDVLADSAGVSIGLTLLMMWHFFALLSGRIRLVHRFNQAHPPKD